MVSSWMKILRKCGWCRYWYFLTALWLVFTFIIISYLRHDPDTSTSNRVTQAVQELRSLRKRESEMLNLLIEFSSRLDVNDRDKFLKHLNQISKNYGLKNEPSNEYETLRRRIYCNVFEFANFVLSQAILLKPSSKNSQVADTSFNNFVNLAGEFKRSLLKDVSSLTEVDGYSEWRSVENEELSSLVQRRLHYLQNPDNCKTAKKLLCDLNKACGYGCQLHHAVYCLIVAYGTERTLILKSQGWRYSRPGWERVFLPVSNSCTTADGVSRSPWPGSPNVQVISLPIVDSVQPKPPFLPLRIPDDLAPRISRIHGDPIVWWIGQFLKYLLRPQPNIEKMFAQHKEKLGFEQPIVGIHIRRTDKVGTEAAFHSLEEYMYHVEEYYKTLELKQPVIQKRVYIATDEPKIFEEARTKYPNYKIIGDASIAQSAAVNNRYSENSLSGIVTDIHFLSMTDYLVCTFSSQVCRAAYEIMNSLRNDASERYRSLDDIYYFGGQTARLHRAVIPHTPATPEEIELRVGDEIIVAGNHWNGFSKGKNQRTELTGLYPTFKVVPKVETASFPTYRQVTAES